MFMNSMEIDEACQRFASHPVLGRATKLLANLRDLADNVSDGWCYWPKPARAARKLQELIKSPGTATEAKLAAAVSPIKAFLTRERRDNWPAFDLASGLAPSSNPDPDGGFSAADAWDYGAEIARKQ